MARRPLRRSGGINLTTGAAVNRQGINLTTGSASTKYGVDTTTGEAVAPPGVNANSGSSLARALMTNLAPQPRKKGGRRFRRRRGQQVSGAVHVAKAAGTSRSAAARSVPKYRR